MNRRSILAAGLAAIVICLAPLWAAQAAPDAQRPALGRPKLVLTIVVDQFRYDYLTRFRAEYTGGLKRLLERGAVFTNAQYEHVPTVTAVGHALILTGAAPATSGIVGNEWYDREQRRQVTSVSDDKVQALGGAGKSGSSPRRLLVSTVGDEMKMSGRAPAKVIGISSKDRAAILMAGRMADGAYWFDTETGNFVSSTWYFAELPAWVKSFNDRRAIDKFAGDGGYEAMMGAPRGNDALELFVEAAVDGENLGRSKNTDLLAVSFSPNDRVGHAKGPDSPEVKEISMETDRVLARLFDFLEKKIGMSRVLVVFTADHGVAPLPELMEQRKMPGGRLAASAVTEAVRKALDEKYGEAKWIVGHRDEDLYLDRKLIADSNLSLAEVQETAAHSVRAIPHIAWVFTSEQLRLGQTPDGVLGRRMEHGFFAERAADLFVVPEPYWLFEQKGTAHGAPWSYDAHVPVIFMGPWAKAGRYVESIAVNDIAPTLATLLDVETPSGSTGRALAEMVAK